MEKRNYPVILFIHGESFEWNSGNLYDGSVIASYGDVIFVSINFRLGIFGKSYTRFLCRYKNVSVVLYVLLR